MNNKGQSTALAIVTALVIFMVGMVVINLLKPDIDLARDSGNVTLRGDVAGLNCANPNSDGTRLTCLAVDSTLPYYMFAIFAVVGGLITSRFLKR